MSGSHAEFLFKVEGIHCASCVQKVSRALEESRLCEGFWLDSATNILKARKGHIGLSDDAFIQEIIKALKSAGYKATLADSQKTQKNEWILQLLAALTGLLLSYFAVPHHSIPFYRSDLMLLVPLFILFVISFRKFFTGALSALRQKNFTVDTLVSLGAGSAFLLSFVLVVVQVPGHLFWVEAFSILLLVSLGHYIENYVLLKADKTLRSLMVLTPQKHLRDKNGKVEEVVASVIAVGDILVLRPGDRVGFDGVIVEGKSDIDESLLSGESLPQSKSLSAKVFAGTHNLSGSLKYKVEKIGQDMLLSQIIDTVIKLRQSRASIQSIADKVSNIFVPVVVVLAIASFALWFFMPTSMAEVAIYVGHSLGLHTASEDVFWRAFSAMLGVLVISCPCAMGLATPTALMAVSGLAARRGILFRNARSIENADKITHVFFDKTGTLSTARPTLVSEWKSVSYQDKFLYPVVSKSRHPMSQSLMAHAPQSNLFASIEEFPGEGLRAECQTQGKTVHLVLGNEQVLERFQVRIPVEVQSFVIEELGKGRSLVYWAQDKNVEAVFSFEDELREGTKEFLADFSKYAEIRILSGDNKKVLVSLAEKVGLKPDQALGELSPLDKVKVLQSYQQQGFKVAFVGDGLNDAPVLQAADLGIAVSTASDLAKQSADIVLLQSDLPSILYAFELAKKGILTIKQNLFWAFAYNVIAIPLAFMGLISPILCTLSMAFSDFVIIANSIRVFLSKPKQITTKANV